MKQIKALTFGEALFDIIKGTAHLGGAPLNLAAHLAKLGAKPAVLTAVGKDELGEILLSRLKKWGSIHHISLLMSTGPQEPLL
nr:PfkB family carbohydrate kinase [Methanosarcina horonobensis]